MKKPGTVRLICKKCGALLQLVGGRYVCVDCGPQSKLIRV